MYPSARLTSFGIADGIMKITTPAPRRLSSNKVRQTNFFKLFIVLLTFSRFEGREGILFRKIQTKPIPWEPDAHTLRPIGVNCTM